MPSPQRFQDVGEERRVRLVEFRHLRRDFPWRAHHFLFLRIRVAHGEVERIGVEVGDVDRP